MEARFCERVQEGDILSVRKALEATPALVGATDMRDVPALCIAIEEELPIMTKILIEAGADTMDHCGANAGELRGATPLTLALKCQRPFIKQFVLQTYLETDFDFGSHSFLSTRMVEAQFDNPVDKKLVRRVLSKDRGKR